MKAFVVLFGMIILLLPQMAAADVIIEGTKSISYGFEISNMYDYAGYVFLAHSQGPMDGYKIMVQGTSASFYKFSTPTVYAIEKNKFNEADVGITPEEIKTYFENNNDLIPSGIEMDIISTVPDTDPTNSILDVLEIKSLDADGFELVKSKVVYTYTDGSTEERLYENQNIRPAASRSSEILYWIIGIVIVVIVIIALIIKVRK